MYLNQVEDDKNTGKLSKTQYQNAMEQVLALVERQKLKKAKRMDSMNDSADTPRPLTSDDDLSADFSEDDDEETKPSQDEQSKKVVTKPPEAIIDLEIVPEIDLTKSNSPPRGSSSKNGSSSSSSSRKSKRWDNGSSSRSRINSIRYNNFDGSLEVKPWKNPSDDRPNVVAGCLIKPPRPAKYDIPRAGSPPLLGVPCRELPPADPLVLDFINNDITRTINIDNKPTEIRFYEDVAVAMMNGDEPIEISFNSGQRRIIFGDKETYMLSFNDVGREVLIGGKIHRVRLGAPTRELYIDNKWYECYFGGPGILIEIDREYRVIKLDGPAPQVQFGGRRTDLCAGRINLIINAKTIIPVYLDAKPQKFDIEGKIHTLRFVDALKTVLINEEPFKVEFGGLPKPVIVHDKKHFIRFTRLPTGIQPGYVKIKDMEGQRGLSPPRVENENSMDRVISLDGFGQTDFDSKVVDQMVTEPALPMHGSRKTEQPVMENPIQPLVPPPVPNVFKTFSKY